MLNEPKPNKQTTIPAASGASAPSGRKKKPDVTRETIKITPEMAKDILDNKNGTNRNLTAKTVAEHAARMDGDEWRLNGDALKFDEFGLLFEGQHRLHAVLQHGKPVVFDVIRGLPYDERFNDGGRPRTLADCLVIAGIFNGKIAPRAAALVEVIGSLLNGKPRLFRSAVMAHKREVMTLGREYRASIEWAVATFPNGSLTPVIGAFAFAHYSKGQKIEDLAGDFLSVNREEGSALVALDAMIAQIRSSRSLTSGLRLEIAHRTLSGIHSGIRGRKLSAIYQSKKASDAFGATLLQVKRAASKTAA